MANSFLLGTLLSILLISSSTTQFVLADGTGNPASELECEMALSDNTNDGNVATMVAPSGEKITEICIKAGSAQSNSDGKAHRGGVITSNGNVDNNCYTVSGIGTSTVTVTKIGSGPNCKEISHLDGNSKPDGVPPQEIVGGEVLSINFTSLLLAGIQLNLAWIAPVVLAGAGLAAYKLRRN